MRRKSGNENLDIVVRKATAEGLSYGEYVAREYEKRQKRKLAPKEYMSLNARKKMGISKPIYFGPSTLDYGAGIDYPNYLTANIGKPKKKKRGRKKKCATN